MIRFKNIILLAFAALLLQGCRKDVIDDFTAYSSSREELSAYLASTLRPDQTTVFTILANRVVPDTVLETASGVRLYLTNTENLFVSAASGILQPLSACKIVKIEIMEATDRSAWLARVFPSHDAEGHLLDNTGAVSVRVTCDGQYMSLSDNRYLKIQVPSVHLSDNMDLGYLANDKKSWEPGESNGVFWAEWPKANGTSTATGYEILTQRMGWVTGILPLSTSGTSTFCAQLPLGFKAENTTAFLVFEQKRIVVEMTPDADGNFCATNIPSGFAVQVVTVSKTGPTYWLGTRKTETASDTSILPVTPLEKNAAEISSFIYSL